MGEQPSLWDEGEVVGISAARSIPLVDGELYLLENWITPDEQRRLLPLLQAELQWEQSQIHLFGKWVDIPRLNAWYGDPGCHYGYSGHQLTLHPWHPELLALRERLQGLGLSVNSVLANWYRDGRDSNGWHSDDEPELGWQPTIASITLGAERSFQLRHKRRAQANLKLQLPSGSLLVMAGAMQQHWQHCLTKTSRPVGPRLNLTYRKIVPRT